MQRICYQMCTSWINERAVYRIRVAETHEMKFFFILIADSASLYGVDRSRQVSTTINYTNYTAALNNAFRCAQQVTCTRWPTYSSPEQGA